MYSGSSDGEGHDAAATKKIPPASSMPWVRNLRRYIGSGAGLGSEALMGIFLLSSPPLIGRFSPFFVDQRRRGLALLIAYQPEDDLFVKKKIGTWNIYVCMHI